MKGYVYLIHFDRPIAPDRHTTQHYVGWEASRGSSIRQHRQGIGSRLRQAALTTPGDRGEREVRRSRNLRGVCPLRHEQWTAGRRVAERQGLAVVGRCIAAVPWLQGVWSALCAASIYW